MTFIKAPPIRPKLRLEADDIMIVVIIINFVLLPVVEIILTLLCVTSG